MATSQAGIDWPARYIVEGWFREHQPDRAAVVHATAHVDTFDLGPYAQHRGPLRAGLVPSGVGLYCEGTPVQPVPWQSISGAVVSDGALWLDLPDGDMVELRAAP